MENTGSLQQTWSQREIWIEITWKHSKEKNTVNLNDDKVDPSSVKRTP